jgi:hypothetical protein
MNILQVEVGWPSGLDGRDILPQYSVCHSKSNDHSFYSIHIIHGEGLQSKNVDSQRPSNFKVFNKTFFSLSTT